MAGYARHDEEAPMCWACEEDAAFRRYQLELAVERGVIPEGFEPADFEAAGLPVPGRKAPAQMPLKSAAAFVCDTPGGE
jgi:hypothetical protein